MKKRIMEYPWFPQVHQYFREITNAMNNFQLLESGGTINWALVQNAKDVGKGPLDVLNRMKDCRKYLAELPENAGVDLDEFDRRISQWTEAAQMDRLPESFTDDWRWAMRYGQPATN